MAKANSYEGLVAKATAEGLTTENWPLYLYLCDKLADNNEANARYMIAAVQRRVAHKNTNVQLYALTLADTLSKNCGKAVHHEIASRAFMQALARLVKDNTTHPLVKKRILALLREWSNEYKDDDTLSLVAETMREFKEEYFDADDDYVDEPVQKNEEDEELRRVLALSLEDQGGRAQDTSVPPDTGFLASGVAMPSDADVYASSSRSVPRAAPVRAPTPPMGPTFVRALYRFQADEPGELAFAAGDVIRVLDRPYEQWWRGELRQQIGIFPVNYVEPTVNPTPSLREEEEMERHIRAHAADIQRLHTRLQHVDPQDNFEDDEELQDLYQRTLSLRPKIARLMDGYHGHVQDMHALNAKFVQARATWEDHMVPPGGAPPRGQTST